MDFLGPELAAAGVNSSHSKILSAHFMPDTEMTSDRTYPHKAFNLVNGNPTDPQYHEEEILFLTGGYS